MGDHILFQDKVNRSGIASFNFRVDDICQQDLIQTLYYNDQIKLCLI
jgi:hypothetical protein